MTINGRRATINPRTMTAEATPDGGGGILIQLDDSSNPEVWLHIAVSPEELAQWNWLANDAQPA